MLVSLLETVFFDNFIGANLPINCFVLIINLNFLSLLYD